MLSHIITSIFLLLLLLALPVQAKLIEADGAAQITNGAKGKAREIALQRAIRQAQLQTLALVDSASVISGNSVVIDSAKISAAGLVKDVVVIREWRHDDIYNVRIRAQVVEEKLRLPSNAARYRKKISVTQFEVRDRRQIFDMPMLEVQLARELQRRMENTGLVLARDGADYLLVENDEYTLNGNAVSHGQALSRVAEELGSQFIVSGAIINMAVQSSWLKTTRYLVLDIAVHDGLSGTLISRHRVNERIAGASYVDSSAGFGSVGFLVSDFGKVMDRVLDDMSAKIIEDLSILPFTARVLQVNGRNITFNAGVTSRVGVGDTLMAYHMANKPTYNEPGRQYLGVQEQPSAAMVVKVVQPQFSIAELESDEITLDPGDIVRFGW